MRCRQCGTEVAEKALICYRCGTATREAKFKAPAAARRRPSRRALAFTVALLLAVLLVILLLFARSGQSSQRDPGAFADVVIAGAPISHGSPVVAPFGQVPPRRDRKGRGRRPDTVLDAAGDTLPTKREARAVSRQS